MKLTVLATGRSAPIHHTSYGAAGYLLETDEAKILIDCGDGIVDRLYAHGHKPSDIDLVFISHFHADHFSPMLFIQDLFVQARHENNTKQIQFVGPNGLKDIVDQITELTSLGGGLEPLAELVKITYHETNELLVAAGLELQPVTVVHGNMNARAFRLTEGDKTVAYSGDATICSRLIEAATNVDLFMCEASVLPVESTEISPIHLSAFQAVDVAKQARAKSLILIHHDIPDSDTNKIQNYAGDLLVTVAKPRLNMTI